MGADLGAGTALMRMRRTRSRKRSLYLKDPEYVKNKQREKMEQFDQCLSKTSGIEDRVTRGLVGMMCLAKSMGEITE